MWIKKLIIQNIRSIEAASLDFSKGINVLVGPNNAGKSTILLPLLSLQDGLPSLIPSDSRLYSTNARADFSVAEVDPTFFRVKSLDKLYLEYVPDQGAFVLRGNKDGTGQVINFSKIGKREPNNFIYPFISKRKVGALHERVTDETVEVVPSNFENLNAKIDRLSNPGFQPAHDLYVRACRDILGFHVFTAHTSEGKRAVYTVRNMNNIPLLSMGEGVANILGLIVHLAIAENRLFLIEEPENDVHPKALKGLMSLIEEKSKDNQFVVTTHSNIVLKRLGSAPESTVFEVNLNFVDRLPT